MKNILGKITIVIVCGVVVFMIVPLVVAALTTAQIIEVNTESQWIGFCGNYLGALIGGILSGGATLYVMLTTLKDNQRTLYTIIENTNAIENARNKRNFASLLIGKIANFFSDIQKVIFKARYYINESKDKEDLKQFINDIHSIRSILWEIELQVSLIRFNEDYIPIKADEIHSLSDKLIDMLGDFSVLVEKTEELDKNKVDLLISKENQIIEYSQKLIDKIEEYSAELIHMK